MSLTEGTKDTEEGKVSMETQVEIRTQAITGKPETRGAFGAKLAGVVIQENGLLTLKLWNVAAEALGVMKPGDFVEVRRVWKESYLSNKSPPSVSSVPL